MIKGVGVDIVNIPRFNKVIRRWGERFMERVFTFDEIAYSSARSRPEETLAGRFAAKEAFIKALGGSHGLSWRDIETGSRGNGIPCFKLDILRFKQLSQPFKAHLSISHDGDYAIAYCVLEVVSEDS